MPASKHQILVTLASVEARSPLYEGDLPLPDAEVRDIFAAAMAGLAASDEFRSASARCREMSLLASLAHALLEAACLRQQLQLQTRHAAVEAAGLIARAAAR